ncbi:hypothetical protein T484DRAFT_1816533 [Baffinella frigidus]|nr:hypothetical protein T484DRAFT_1816533 [Cryptophyta sp. CCMP2293]
MALRGMLGRREGLVVLVASFLLIAAAFEASRPPPSARSLPAVTRGGSQVELAARQGIPVPSWLVAPVVSLNTNTGDDAASSAAAAPSAPVRVAAADASLHSTDAHSTFVRARAPPAQVGDLGWLAAAPQKGGDLGWLAAAPSAPKKVAGVHPASSSPAFQDSSSEWLGMRAKLYKAVHMFHKYGDKALESLIPAKKTAAMLKVAKEDAKAEIKTLQQTAATSNCTAFNCNRVAKEDAKKEIKTLRQTAAQATPNP